MLVVAIMMAFEAQISTEAIHKHGMRPMYSAKKPADDEERNAPRVIRDEISCWRSVEMLYPIGEVGSGWP